MKLFELDKNWELQLTEEIWGIPVFKKILDRDKSKDKKTAFKEMLFVYFYCDIKSDYIITPEEHRIEEIKKDIQLPNKWKIDKELQAAIDFYNERSKSIIVTLYESAIKSANDISGYLQNTESLLKERSNNGTTVVKINEITNALKSIPGIMRDLKASYKEVVKEIQDTEGKKKGSRQYNTFEEGLTFE